MTGEAAFQHRGVIEGFYGTPWSHEDRLHVIGRLGAWGMNRYVYAPKEDPLHRARWREPYPDDFVQRFAELVAAGERAGVAVGFAISPGLSIRYSAADERADLTAKLRAFLAQGVRFFALCLDDVPSALAHAEDRAAFASLAAAHVALAHEVARALGPDATLWLVPTDYLGVAPTDYLEEMGASLDPRIEVGWTGRTTCSPTIELAEARVRAAALRRRLLLWDNVPVADGPMRPMLHLAPYTGRASGLAACVSGVLLNPMQHARASGLSIRCAAAYLRDPAGYDAERAWDEAAAELGAGAPEAFRLFARAHRFAPQTPDDRDGELEAGLAALRDAFDLGRDARAPLEALRGALAARAAVADALRSGLRDARLLAEIEPWIASHAAETRRMQAALDLLAALASAGPRKDAVFACFRYVTRSSEPPPAQVSYGPRRLLYPQLASMRDESMGFGRDPWLLRGRCLADDFVALADARAQAMLG
ncbi:MAG TPA: beta-N-acetylglucosaminidase domain-containing protein [Myxococcota bacterium]|nr:beta-N-acetylglucosaminidase domain-containing protein [Myxococcota bacterium]